MRQILNIDPEDKPLSNIERLAAAISLCDEDGDFTILVYIDGEYKEVEIETRIENFRRVVFMCIPKE